QPRGRAVHLDAQQAEGDTVLPSDGSRRARDVTESGPDVEQCPGRTRPSSPARRMTPAPARPPASRRTTRSGARCRGAVPRPRPDPRADRPAARCRSSVGEARVAAPIVEQGPAVGNAATRDDAEEHRVIPAWDLGLFFALDAGEHAVEHRDAVLALLVAD